MNPPTIVVLDDDELSLAAIPTLLDEYKVVTCRHVTHLPSILSQVSPRLLIVDYYLGQDNGVEIAERLPSYGYGYDLTAILFISSSREIDLSEIRQRVPNSEFICKGDFDNDGLKMMVEQMLDVGASYRISPSSV